MCRYYASVALSKRFKRNTHHSQSNDDDDIVILKEIINVDITKVTSPFQASGSNQSISVVNSG